MAPCLVVLKCRIVMQCQQRSMQWEYPKEVQGSTGYDPRETYPLNPLTFINHHEHPSRTSITNMDDGQYQPMANAPLRRCGAHAMSVTWAKGEKRPGLKLRLVISHSRRYLELGPLGYPGYAGKLQKQKQYCGTMLGGRWVTSDVHNFK